MAHRLECMACGAQYPADEIRYECDRVVGDPPRRCGGLLDVRHDLDALKGHVSVRTFESRVGAWTGPAASGVWRYREIVLPGAGRRYRHAPGRQHPVVSQRAPGGLDRGAGPADQARGGEPDGLVQGPRHDGGDYPGAAPGVPGRGLCLHGQHIGVAGGLRGAGRHERLGVRAGRQDRPGQAGAGAGLRRADPTGSRRLRRGHGSRPARVRRGRASTC